MTPPHFINLLIDDIAQLHLNPTTGALSISTQPKKNAGAEELTLVFHFNPGLTRQLHEELLNAQRLLARLIESMPLTDALH